MTPKILISITTTAGSDWRSKPKEADDLGIQELAIFVTCLDLSERQELYDSLLAHHVTSIPFAHVKGDMPLQELEFLRNTFGTKVFNIHDPAQYIAPYYYGTFSSTIGIENTVLPLQEETLKKFGGICLDISHMENDRLNSPMRYEHNLLLLEHYPILVNHISAIRPESRIDEDSEEKRNDYHFLKNLNEVDYVKNWKKFLAPYVALELENSLTEQIKIKAYLENLLTS
ncbi:MAG TPA: hypothetical protein PLX10_01680 [Candidatus Paceibacterota bacterium]|nr:hypothetical protein [Candidatus Paceibacterota bacterium]